MMKTCRKRCIIKVTFVLEQGILGY